MRRSMAPKRSRCHLHSAYMVLVCIAWLNREYIVDIGKLRMVLPAVEWCQLYGETEGYRIVRRVYVLAPHIGSQEE